MADACVAAAGLGLALVVLEGSWWWAIVRVLVLGAFVARVVRAIEVRPRRGTGFIVATTGLVGAAVGGAVIASYLDGGWSIRLAGGLLAASGGMGAFTIGVVAVVRSFRGWRRIVTIPLVALATYTVGFPIAMSVYATNVGRPEVARETPADRGLDYVDVTFATSDGITLSGWYVPSTNRAAVVVLHGASSTRSAVLDEAMVVARHGYGVLLYDARGMGRSGGRAMNFGWYGDLDVAAAVDFLRSRPDVDATRIGALGESMGGEEAIGAIARDPHLRAVVAEGATNRVSGDWDWLSDAYGLRGYFQRGVHDLTYLLTDVLTDASPPITLRDAVTLAAPRPVLLIAAGNVADEVHADRDIQRASLGTVQLWIAPGANHTGGLAAQPAEWEQRVTSFFESALRSQ